MNQQLTRLLLQRLGHTADVVGDGAAAVTAVGTGRYDVVLMDGQMPVMDGLTATRAIRALPGPQPWVVALTAGAFVEDREAFLAAGADVFCTKPLRLQVLAAALESVTSSEGAPARVDVPAGVLDDEVVEDLRTLRADDLHRLVSRFAGRLPRSVTELRDAAERDEPLDRLAHTLKGSSGSFGAARVAEVCRELEESQLSTANRAALLDRLEDEARAAVAALEAMLAEVPAGVPSQDATVASGW